MAGRFIRSKDLEFFDTVNKELLGNPQTDKSGIINQEVVVYKVSVYETETNLYGEASSGKRYQNGVKLTCLITADDFDYDTNDFGPIMAVDDEIGELRSFYPSNLRFDPPFESLNHIGLTRTMAKTHSSDDYRQYLLQHISPDHLHFVQILE